MSNLPSACPDHPTAQIKHEWDRTHYIMNGYPAGRGLDSNHHYYCAECGTEVCPPEEFEQRKKEGLI